MTRSLPILIPLSAALFAAGCGVNRPFVLMDDGYALRPASLAVVAGDNNAVAVRLAEILTKSLKERSPFKIVDQDEIQRRIPKYPMAIAEASPKDASKPVWVGAPGRARLDDIQKSLKVSYLFVVWGDGVARQSVCNGNGGCSTSYFMTVRGNLIEYPAGRPVSFTHIDESEAPHIYKLTTFKSSNYFINSMIDDACRRIAEDVAAKIGGKGRT